MKLVIIAGGKGTRLGFNDIPKPMVKIGEKPNLELQIELAKRYGINEIFILSGHLANIIFDYFGNGEKFGVKITHIIEPYPLGTAGCIKMIEHLISDRFMVFYGDVVMDVDLESFIEFDKKYQPIATILTHPNDHPDDSDLVETDFESNVIAFHSKPHPEGKLYKNLVNAAVYILSKEVFKYIEEGKSQDFGKDIFPKILNSKKPIKSYKSPEYVKDMGTKDRLPEVIDDFMKNKVSQMNKINKRKAVFLDRDGVINKYIDNLCKIDDFELIENVPAALMKLNKSGILGIVVTNQPMIAKGFLTENQLEEIHKKMETTLGQNKAYVDAIYFCPHHPDKGFEGERIDYKINCSCRKPDIGMISKAVEELNIDLNRSFIIGDTTVDIMTGKNAGIKTILVKTGAGGKDNKFDVKPDYIFNSLNEAVDFIIANGN